MRRSCDRSRYSAAMIAASSSEIFDRRSTFTTLVDQGTVAGTAAARKAGPKTAIIAARCSPDGFVWPWSHFSLVEEVTPITLARCAAVDRGNAALMKRQKPSISSRNSLRLCTQDTWKLSMLISIPARREPEGLWNMKGDSRHNTNRVESLGEVTTRLLAGLVAQNALKNVGPLKARQISESAAAPAALRPDGSRVWGARPAPPIAQNDNRPNW